MTQSPALRAIAEAAEACRDRLAAAEIGRLTEHATSTITRREASALPVAQWPALDVLRLARVDGDLRKAIIGYLEHQPALVGDPSSVVHDLCVEAQASAALSIEVRQSLADGVLTGREIDLILARIDERRKADETLARDLRAQLRSVRA